MSSNVIRVRKSCIAAFAMQLRCSGSCLAWTIALASTEAAPDCANPPFQLLSMISGFPPIAITTAGTPPSVASSSSTEVPSQMLESTSRSMHCTSCRASARYPVNTTRPCKPGSCPCSRTAGNVGPSPTSNPRRRPEPAVASGIGVQQRRETIHRCNSTNCPDDKGVLPELGFRSQRAP